jgi:hypothetical protein
MLVVARDAFEAALGRFHAEQDAVEAFAPATEVLWWACALDERLAEMDPTYKQRRQADQDGRLLAGVRWARNRANHQLGLVTASRPAGAYGGGAYGTFPYGGGSFIAWASAASIPVGSNERGRDVYEARMQGHRVAETIDAPRRWFHGGAGSDLTLNFGPP